MEKAEEGGLPSSPRNEGGLSSSPRNEGGSSSSPEKKGGWLSIIGSLTGIILFFGLLGVLLWYFIAHTYPRCYIENFDVLALKQTTHAFEYNTIEFEVKLVNRRSRDKGVYYDALNFTFYYKPNNNLSSYLIGNSSIDPFYQRRHRHSSYRSGHFEAKGITWENVTTPAMFRVELTTATRYRELFWKSKRRHMVVGADIQVNDKGNLAKGKKLKSNNAGRISKSRLHVVGILIIFIIVHSW